MIDEFTIIEAGRELLTMEADTARDRFKKIRARFAQTTASTDFAAFSGVLSTRQNGREVEILANGHSDAIVEKLRLLKPDDVSCESLSLEEIFIASKALKQKA